MSIPQTPAVRILGICGAPGAGKSTLAAQIAAEHGAAVVPMDGFHLADAELARRGLLTRKGAPETFDAEGYAVLLGRIRESEGHVLAPAFDRRIEQAVAGSIPVPPTGLVITEGSYLLLDEPRWRAVHALLDVVWHLEADDAARRRRLVARHVEFGKTPAAARAWVERVDDPNAALVATAAHRADLVVGGGGVTKVSTSTGQHPG